MMAERMTSAVSGGLAVLALGLWQAAAGAEHDIAYLAEHAPESAMDAAYMALPWPGGRLVGGTAEESVDLAFATTDTEFMKTAGPVVAAAFGRGLGSRWGYELLGYYSDMRITGGGGRTVLAPPFLTAEPLDLPQQADFSAPRGRVRQYGAGAALVYDYAAEGPHRFSQLIAGLLLQHLDVTGFRMNYTLLGGADAGATGVLDRSVRASFTAPFAAWQRERPLGRDWSWSLRAMAILALPPADFGGGLSGPGFDLSAPHGGPQRIGDAFGTAGLALQHIPSGLEIDFGDTLYFYAAEGVSHPGVTNALLLHVAWRRRRSR